MVVEGGVPIVPFRTFDLNPRSYSLTRFNWARVILES
jgi:hypothetical protein